MSARKRATGNLIANAFAEVFRGIVPPVSFSAEGIEPPAHTELTRRKSHDLRSRQEQSAKEKGKTSMCALNFFVSMGGGRVQYA
ncbi:MAG: hypothetical protein HC767_00045 [Akkermansiaceae bacterium]|nr:hypothetical protein [Akkermansiaceae bacterium]